LPCNVIVEEHEDGTVEISAVDPLASMQVVENDDLKTIANQVKEMLSRVIQSV